MDTVFEFLRNVYQGIVYAMSYDFQNFRNVFHGTGWLLFFIIRVLPLMATAFVLGRMTYARRTRIKLTVNQAIQFVLSPTPIPPKVFFAIILMLAVVLRIWFAVTLPLIPEEGDAISRLQQAKEWYDTFKGIPGNLVWLPLHHCIIGFGSLFGLNIFWSSRFITLLFALLTFPVFYSLVNKKFGNSVALISCFLLAVNPFHIRYSVITMSEVPFIFFAVSALWALFSFIEKGRKKYLLLSALCLSCCSLIRFEGWILAGLMSSVLFYYKRDRKQFFAFAAINSIVILAYMLVSLLTTGHLVEGLTVSDLTVKNAFAHKEDKGGYVLHNLSTGLIYPLWMFVVLFYGVYLAIKERKELPWLLVPVTLMVITAWKMLNYTSEPFWRYFSTGMFLILPFAAYSLLSLMRINKWFKLLALPVILILFAEGIYSQHEYGVAIRPVPEGFYEMASWFRLHHQRGERFLFYSARDYASFLMLANASSGEIYHPYPPEMKVYKYYEDFSDTVLMRELNTHRYSYIIYQVNSEMGTVFNNPQVQEEIKQNGITPEPVYENVNYRIWLLSN